MTINEMEFNWRLNWWFRPTQLDDFGTSVADYYDCFCDWKSTMELNLCPASEGDYVDAFIQNLRCDIRSRLPKYILSGGLFFAFLAAKLEESMIRIDEGFKKNGTLKPFVEMPRRTPSWNDASKVDKCEEKAGVREMAYDHDVDSCSTELAGNLSVDEFSGIEDSESSSLEDDESLNSGGGTSIIDALSAQISFEEGTHKVFDDLTEPILETYGDVYAENAAAVEASKMVHNSTEVISVGSKSISGLYHSFSGKPKGEIDDDCSIPLVDRSPLVFDPGSDTTENKCTNGSSKNEILDFKFDVGQELFHDTQDSLDWKLQIDEPWDPGPRVDSYTSLWTRMFSWGMEEYSGHGSGIIDVQNGAHKVYAKLSSLGTTSTLTFNSTEGESMAKRVLGEYGFGTENGADKFSNGTIFVAKYITETEYFPHYVGINEVSFSPHDLSFKHVNWFNRGNFRPIISRIEGVELPQPLVVATNQERIPLGAPIDCVPLVFDPGTSIFGEDLGAAATLNMPLPKFWRNNELIQPSTIHTAKYKVIEKGEGVYSLQQNPLTEPALEFDKSSEQAFTGGVSWLDNGCDAINKRGNEINGVFGTSFKACKLLTEMLIDYIFCTRGAFNLNDVELVHMPGVVPKIVIDVGLHFQRSVVEFSQEGLSTLINIEHWMYVWLGRSSCSYQKAYVQRVIYKNIHRQGLILVSYRPGDEAECGQTAFVVEEVYQAFDKGLKTNLVELIDDMKSQLLPLIMACLRRLDCDFLVSKNVRQDLDTMPSTSLVELWFGRVSIITFDPGGGCIYLVDTMNANHLNHKLRIKLYTALLVSLSQLFNWGNLGGHFVPIHPCGQGCLQEGGRENAMQKGTMVRIEVMLKGSDKMLDGAFAKKTNIGIVFMGNKGGLQRLSIFAELLSRVNCIVTWSTGSISFPNCNGMVFLFDPRGCVNKSSIQLSLTPIMVSAVFRNNGLATNDMAKQPLAQCSQASIVFSKWQISLTLWLAVNLVEDVFEIQLGNLVWDPGLRVEIPCSLLTPLLSREGAIIWEENEMKNCIWDKLMRCNCQCSTTTRFADFFFWHILEDKDAFKGRVMSGTESSRVEVVT